MKNKISNISSVERFCERRARPTISVLCTTMQSRVRVCRGVADRLNSVR